MGTAKEQMTNLLKELTVFTTKTNENFESLFKITKSNEQKLDYLMNEIGTIKETLKELQSNISPQVESVKVQVEDIMNKVSGIPNPTTPTWAEVASSSTSNAQNVARTIINAMNDDAAREKSIMLYNVEEVDDDNTRQQVLDFASESGLSINGDDIEKVFRLGRKERNKMRPIKLSVNSKETRNDIIEQSAMLKDINTIVRIMPDRSEDERKRVKELNDEAKSRNNDTENPPKNGFVWAVVGKLQPQLLQIKKKVRPARVNNTTTDTTTMSMDPSTTES